jgi:hypothetical protein
MPPGDPRDGKSAESGADPKNRPFFWAAHLVLAATMGLKFALSAIAAAIVVITFRLTSSKRDACDGGAIETRDSIDDANKIDSLESRTDDALPDVGEMQPPDALHGHRVQQPGGGFVPEDPRWEWWKKMKKADREFEWRMPIRFYGKIVDWETGDPVEGARVKLTWTDLSERGSSEANLTTDAAGSFSLTGKTGKLLVVSVLGKEGYEVARASNPHSFEYAAFFESTYHRPDPDHPVVFRVRKKMEADSMMHHEGSIKIDVGRREKLNLDAKTQLEIEVLTNGQLSEKQWSARLTVTPGGIQVSTDEFPVTAPLDGYAPFLFVDMNTPKPPQWSGLYQGGQFFVQTSSGYGRIDLRTISGKTFMRYSIWINPSGSRKLELDPAKKMVP